MYIISTKNLDRAFIEHLFSIADTMPEHGSALHNKIMASLFYEPSTRTRFSFESAMLRLGGAVMGSDAMLKSSSVAKGESLEDTVRVVSMYADIIVLRHFEAGAAARAALASSVPFINAGDGAGEHPTQALLDVYTMQKELGKVDGMSIALVGDLKNGRTVHSLVYVLAKYTGVQFYFVSPASLALPPEIKVFLDYNNIQYQETETLDSIISQIDVLYLTRIQKERFLSEGEFLHVKDSIVLSTTLVQRMKRDAIIMHPLPRTTELPISIDMDHRAVYFKQPRYGLKIRMALLKSLLI